MNLTHTETVIKMRINGLTQLTSTKRIHVSWTSAASISNFHKSLSVFFGWSSSVNPPPVSYPASLLLTSRKELQVYPLPPVFSLLSSTQTHTVSQNWIHNNYCSSASTHSACGWRWDCYLPPVWITFLQIPGLRPTEPATHPSTRQHSDQFRTYH